MLRTSPRDCQTTDFIQLWGTFERFRGLCLLKNMKTSCKIWGIRYDNITATRIRSTHNGLNCCSVLKNSVAIVSVMAVTWSDCLTMTDTPLHPSDTWAGSVDW